MHWCAIDGNRMASSDKLKCQWWQRWASPLLAASLRWDDRPLAERLLIKCWHLTRAHIHTPTRTSVTRGVAYWKETSQVKGQVGRLWHNSLMVNSWQVLLVLIELKLRECPFLWKQLQSRAFQHELQISYCATSLHLNKIWLKAADEHCNYTNESIFQESDKLCGWFVVKHEQVLCTSISCSVFGGVRWNEDRVTEDMSTRHAVNI